MTRRLTALVTTDAEIVSAPRFSAHRTARGAYELADARGLLVVVLQGADAYDVEAARRYADRFNRMPDAELDQLAAVAVTNVNPIDVDAAGLPTVTGYRQLYQIALEQLQEAEPTWPHKRRERVARAMTEAYCQAAASEARRDAVAGEGGR